MKKEGFTISLQFRTVAFMTGALLAFLMPTAVRAATLFVSPASGILRPDGILTVTVRLNTQGVSVNAAEGVIKFDPQRLRVDSVTTGGSIINLNVQEPDFSNTDGTVSFGGIILNPGYTGASGNLLTIKFRARTAGTAAVTFTSGAALANDGKGTNVLTALNGGTYSISGTETPGPTPTGTPAPVPDSLLPVVTSPTHPDATRWYPDNDPAFTWTLPDGVDGVSWMVHEKADANPGNESDGLVSEITFSDVPDGATYFHIKFRRNGGWGPIRHLPFRVDTVAPLPFTVSRGSGESESEPRPALFFETSDETSGVFRYSMRVGDGDWFDVAEAPADHPYRMPLQGPGVHPVTVEAIDGAGLTARAQTVITVTSITSPVIRGYPETTEADSPFEVVGTAEPLSQVTLRAFRAGIAGRSADGMEPEASAIVQADASGMWRLTVEGLGVGTWRLVAVSQDTRGAVSYPSESATVRSGSWLLRLWQSLPVWFTALPWWMRVLLSVLAAILLLSVAWLLWSRRNGFPVVSAKRQERTVKSKLEEIIRDMEVEIATIVRLADSRPLYPEEQHLKNKLLEYRTVLKRLAGRRSSPRIMHDVR